MFSPGPLPVRQKFHLQHERSLQAQGMISIAVSHKEDHMLGISRVDPEVFHPRMT
jgi:hypothetical protein